MTKQRGVRRCSPWSAQALGAASALLVLSIAGRCAAQAETAESPAFEERVLPLLESRCVRCHGERKSKAGLRLDSLEAVLRGGESGRAIAPGEPDASRLVRAVRWEDEDLRMPPKERLPQEEVARIEAWVRNGAPELAEATAEGPAGNDDPFTAEDRSWWAFRPLASVEPPRSEAAPGEPDAVHPVDAFLRTRMREAGVEPAPRAGRRTLIRRLSFDLRGMPPSAAEVEAFLADRAPDAWERQVDRWLASPRYGERQARRWLDLVRYAESDGFRADDYRPLAWKYRDWVIRAFDEDMPWDRFVLEQLAGDEALPDDADAMVATGYLRLGPYEHNQRDLHRHRSEILDDITEITGEAFLGLTVGCARCHDHKFDAILREDFYRLRAFFEGVFPADDLVAATRAERAEHARAMERWREATRDVRRKIEAIEAPVRRRLEKPAVEKFLPVYQKLLERPLDSLDPLERQIRHLADRQLRRAARGLASKIPDEKKEEWERLQAELDAFDHIRPEPLPPARGVVDVGPEAPPTVIPDDPREEPVPPGFLTVLEPGPAELPEPAVGDGRSTGRRTALARWIGRPDNALVLRVVVNRIWQGHFGRGIVATPNNLGRQGEPPTHPELLDWLCREFVRHGLRFKPLHRLILTSEAYRRAATGPEAEAARDADPENRLLARRDTRRLEAEALRDALLATSGELDLRRGGEGAGPDAPRRAVYLRVFRNKRVPLLDAFDAPDRFNSCARREVTTTAPQALLLLHGEWTLERARAFARRLLREVPGSGPEAAARRVRQAFRRALARPPDEDELEAALRFLAEQEAALASEGTPTAAVDAGDGSEAVDASGTRAVPGGLRPARFEALCDLAHTLLVSGEFVHVD